MSFNPGGSGGGGGSIAGSSDAALNNPATGEVLTYDNDIAKWKNATALAGADGKTVLSGSGVPTNGNGSDDDFYIDLDTYMIYKKAAGAWGGGVSLVGPQGSQGEQGPVGADGAPGADGQSGPLLYHMGHAGSAVVGSGTARMYNDTGRTLTLQSVRVSAGTAPTGASLRIDVNKNGSTIFTSQSNRPSIAAGSNASTRVTSINDTSWGNGEYLTIDIDEVGSTVAGSDITVTIVAI